MRYLILVASVIIQACLGGLYAWTTFAPYLKQNYGLSSAQTQTIFGCLFGVFTLTMFFTGRLLDRLGPKLLAAVGGMLFAGGYLVASYSGGSFLLLLIGITLLTGLGTGFGYVVPLAICARWFPRDKGLVTGLAVAGFGGGAILLTSLGEPQLQAGMDVLLLFRWIALIYGVAIVCSALLLRSPDELPGTHHRQPLQLRTLRADPVFWALVVGMFSGTFGGLLVVGALREMADETGLSPAMAVLSVSLFAAGNAAGRILWGYVDDHLRGPVMLYNLLLLALALGVLLPALTLGSPLLFVLCSSLVGFGFGGCFVIYAAETASRYGIDRVANVYPIIFLSYGAAGSFGPLIGGALHDATDSYVPGVAISITVIALGLAAARILLREARRSSIVHLEKPLRSVSI